MLVLVLIMVIDGSFSAAGQQAGRREVPGEHRKRLEARLLRRQPGVAAAPDAGAPPAGQPRRQDRLTAVRVLVLGGIRSGKSAWAESAIAACGRAGPVRYVATGGHRLRRRGLVGPCRRAPAAPIRRTGRPSKVRTWQRNCAPIRPPDARRRHRRLARPPRWTAVMRGPARRCAPSRRPASTPSRRSPAPLVLVSPEVGLTVVPATDAGPPVRRRAGHASTSGWPQLCDRVVLVVAGQPVTVKEPS